MDTLLDSQRLHGDPGAMVEITGLDHHKRGHEHGRHVCSDNTAK